MAGSARRIVVEFLGDGKKLSGELTDLSNKTSKFGSFMAKAGKAAALGLGAGLVVAGAAAVKFGQAAAEDAQAAELLAGALERNADATNKQIAATEDWITAQGRSLGITDDELRPALARLVTATHDVSEAQRLASLAMNVSAGTGKSLESVSTALMKAQNGQVSALSRLGINTKNAAGETIGMEEATRRMAETFGGAAVEKAGTFQGKMDRLKLMMSETGEAIGYKLIPVGIKLMDWVTGSAIPAITKLSGWLGEHLMPKVRQLGDWIETKVVPAVRKFAEQMRSGEGAGGQFADALGKMRDALVKVWGILQPVLTFMANNKTVVATFAGVILTVVVAVKAWTIAQAALNIVLSANPIGLVVIAIAALAAGLVYAWKRSSDFREGVNTMWNLLKKFIGFTPLGTLISNFGAVRDAVQWVIDKVNELWGKLEGVGGKLSALKDIAGTLGGILKRGAGGGGGGKGGGFGNAGLNLIEDIVKGITKHKVKLDVVLDKLRDYIAKKMDKLQALLDKRQAILDTFRGFTSSLFSTDLSTGEGEAPKTIQALLDFQAQAKAKAQQLAASVKALISKGLSKDLLHQLMAAGEAGQDQINLLATGTAEQIQQANADNLATQMALQEAGLAASEALGIEQAIKQEERDLKLAEMIKSKLDDLLKMQDKNTVVQLKIGGHVLHVTLLELKRKRGGELGLA